MVCSVEHAPTGKELSDTGCPIQLILEVEVWIRSVPSKTLSHTIVVACVGKIERAAIGLSRGAHRITRWRSRVKFDVEVEIAESRRL